MDDHTHFLTQQAQDIEFFTSLLSRIKQETREARRWRNVKVPDRSTTSGLGWRSAPLYRTLGTTALSEKWGRHKNSPYPNALKNELHELQVFLLASNRVVP
jgi:hypothetical protein